LIIVAETKSFNSQTAMIGTLPLQHRVCNDNTFVLGAQAPEAVSATYRHCRRNHGRVRIDFDADMAYRLFRSARFQPGGIKSLVRQ
jgi:hypothetical protein